MNQPAQPTGTSVLPLSVAYFYSGWTFLVPYLAVYLLYAWMEWPVNPVGVSGRENDAWNWVPCLLYVYWFLHALLFAAGATTLFASWRKSAAKSAMVTGGKSCAVGFADQSPQATPAHADAASSSVLARIGPLLSWVLLGLFFFIPGVYMEYPSDPWQHFARLNEWHWLQSVTEHTTWGKFSYFLAYSFIGGISPPLLQIKGFDIYYTICCLLLCWQYYRLARTMGLGEQGSFLFVLLQALLSGNSSFGFYRYYGMSSTVFAQLGAVALTRLALESLPALHVQKPGTHIPGVLPAPQSLRPFFHQSVSCTAKLVASSLLLLGLTACSHIQGVIIAGVGIFSVLVWRLLEWRRVLAVWLGSGVILLSLATVFWYQKHPLLESRYGPERWFSPWLGFNLFSAASPAHERSVQIVGVFGLFNLFAGLWLIRRNHVAGWLTVMPVLLLSLPVFAIPFASILAASSEIPGGYIIVFHRVLFAIPAGLALVTIYSCGPFKHRAELRAMGSATLATPNVSRTSRAFALLTMGVAVFVLVPPGAPWFNRAFSFLMGPAHDLTMQHVVDSDLARSRVPHPRDVTSVEQRARAIYERAGVVTTPGLGYVLNASGATRLADARKWMTWPIPTPPSLTLSEKLGHLAYVGSASLRRLPLPPRTHLYSPMSQLGFITGHWLPSEVALEHAGQEELLGHPPAREAARRPPTIRLEWQGPANPKPLYAKASGPAPDVIIPQDRQGDRDEAGPQQRLAEGESLLLRPVLRTMDGNGGNLTLILRGPGVAADFITWGNPDPLGGETWIVGNHEIRLGQPGDYTVIVRSTVFWPIRTYEATFSFRVVAPLNDPSAT